MNTETLTVTVKSSSEARVVESFRTAASQAYRAAFDLRSFFSNAVRSMDEGHPHMTEGLPSAAEMYTRSDARMKDLFQLLPEGIEFEAIQAMMRSEFVSIRVAE